LWEAYLQEFDPEIVAVARPHHFVWVGEKVTLDGSRSWSRAGEIAGYDWTFTGGGSASGPTVERIYEKAGMFSEVLKVTDATGHASYDFAVVQVVERQDPDPDTERVPPTIHPAFHPTTNLRPGDPVTFKVRTFRTTAGKEKWDFGDGSPPVMVKSDGNVETHAKDGYAVTTHSFEESGDYLVSVERTNERGETAVARLLVRVGEGD
ncbi:MAG: PKD domain-containing protein, partial [Acidobacteria bacterium]|nr:PKD domain-containing protein [Acidobacteriota bacterium]